MKVIFLDIDGVLNSEQFFQEHIEDLEQFPVDRECVRRLSDIVHATNAKIVLTSSWRTGWSRDPNHMEELCRKMVEILAEYHLEIFDKTDWLRNGKRGMEIRRWIHRAPEKVETLVILDDNDFHWKRYLLHKYWVQTDFSEGGLQDDHVARAVKILMAK